VIMGDGMGSTDGLGVGNGVRGGVTLVVLPGVRLAALEAVLAALAL